MWHFEYKKCHKHVVAFDCYIDYSKLFFCNKKTIYCWLEYVYIIYIIQLKTRGWHIDLNINSVNEYQYSVMRSLLLQFLLYTSSKFLEFSLSIICTSDFIFHKHLHVIDNVFVMLLTTLYLNFVTLLLLLGEQHGNHILAVDLSG